MSVRTIGVDLSAQPRNTAVCVVEWHAAAAQILELGAGADDEALLGLVAAHRPTKIAIDAPFGWPVPFVEAVVDFTSSGRWHAGADRRPLVYRTTDCAVIEETGFAPLSVASDRIAVCAMRCAGLLAALAGGEALDRTGGGLVAEVYPAAALRQWSVDPRGYKGPGPEKRAKRAGLLAEFAAATSGWLRLNHDRREQLLASDHLLDALISALVGRALEVGQTLPVPEEHRARAAAEGWIHLPRRRLLAEFEPFA